MCHHSTSTAWKLGFHTPTLVSSRLRLPQEDVTPRHYQLSAGVDKDSVLSVS